MIFREKRKSSIITDSGLASSEANRDGKNGNRHIIGGKKDGKERARRKREIKVKK
jgi:hypothetical protein